MAIVSNLDLIRRVPLLSNLSPAQSSLVANLISKKRYKRGELLIEEGKTSYALFVILSGKVRVLSQDERGHKVIMAVLDAGDCVGEMSLIDGEPHSATMRLLSRRASCRERV